MELTLSDIIRIFKRWQWIFWAVVIATTIATVGVYKILPKEYEASAILKVEGLSGGVSLGGLGSIIGISGGGSKADDYMELLKSRMVLENVVRKLDLVNLFMTEETKRELKEKGYTDSDFIYIVAKSIENNLDVSTIGKSSLISVSYKHKDPNIAYKIVNTIVDEFLTITKQMSYQSINQKKEFLQQKLSQYEKELKKELTSYVEFQKKHGIISLEDELAVRAELVNKLQMEYLKSLLITKELPKNYSLSKEELSYFQGATEDVLGELINQLVNLESQLVAMKAMYSEDNINVQALKLQIEDLKKRINALKLSGIEDTKSLTNLYKKDMEKFLDVEPEYFFIQSRLDLLKNLTTFTWQQYIQVMLSEISLLSPVTIISKARLTHIPKTLSTKLIGAIGGALGIFLGILLVFWKESSSKYVTDHIIYASERNITNYHIVKYKKYEKDLKKLGAKLKDLKGIILVTSPNKSDGKTTIAENIAQSMAKLGKKVLLIDGNPLNKTLSSKYNFISNEGFSEGNLKVSKIGSFDLIPFGKGSDVAKINTSDLMNLKEKYDLIIIDSPDYDSDPITIAKYDEISDKDIIVISEMNSLKEIADELYSNISNKLSTVIFNKVRWVK